MEERRGFNEGKLWPKMFLDDDTFKNCLKDLGLLHPRRYSWNKEINLCSPRAIMENVMLSLQEDERPILKPIVFKSVL